MTELYDVRPKELTSIQSWVQLCYAIYDKKISIGYIAMIALQTARIVFLVQL